MATLGVWDYIIIGIVHAISVAIGLYYRFSGSRQKTTAQFLLADRSMSVTPIAVSLMSSFMSAITMLGVSMENYQYGTMFMVINFSYWLATPIVVYLILPVFYQLKNASAYEYLEMRFGYAVRLYASLAFSLQMLLYMGIVLYAPALALEAVTGLDLLFSIIIVGAVCTFYSTLGGMKAVLITDLYQAFLMFIAVFSVIICAWIKAGSIEEIWRTAELNGRIKFNNWSIDPTERHTWFSLVIGGMVSHLTIYGVNQTQVQRIMTARSYKAAQAAVWWSVPLLSVLSLSTCFSGICIYWYYKDCDPLLEGRITSRDQLMPLFVVDTMSQYVALSGLFVSGIFCASLSTLSSGISSLAAVTLEDYIKPFVKYTAKHELNEFQTLLYSKLLSLFFGTACIGIAFLSGAIGGLLQAALSIFGIVGGPLLGVFSLGMFTTLGNQKGAITGLITGLMTTLWIGFGKPKPPVPTLDFSIAQCPVAGPTLTSHISDIFQMQSSVSEAPEEHYFYLYRISYMWYATIGFLVTFFAGLIFSWCYYAIKWDTNAQIYTDAECTTIKYELFVPPLSKYLRRKQTPVVLVTDIRPPVEKGCINSAAEFNTDDLTKLQKEQIA